MAFGENATGAMSRGFYNLGKQLMEMEGTLHKRNELAQAVAWRREQEEAKKAKEAEKLRIDNEKWDKFLHDSTVLSDLDNATPELINDIAAGNDVLTHPNFKPYMDNVNASANRSMAAKKQEDLNNYRNEGLDIRQQGINNQTRRTDAEYGDGTTKGLKREQFEFDENTQTWKEKDANVKNAIQWDRNDAIRERNKAYISSLQNNTFDGDNTDLDLAILETQNAIKALEFKKKNNRMAAGDDAILDGYRAELNTMQTIRAKRAGNRKTDPNNPAGL